MNTIELLIKRAQKGDDHAFLELFNFYKADIYRMAFVYVKNQADALDVVQEVAYRSFLNIKTLQQPKYLKTWLIRITIHCALDLLKANKQIVALPEYEEVQDVGSLDLPTSLTLSMLVEQLDDEEKTMIQLKYYQDFTFQEIAALLQIPLGTTKTILYRAIGKLRKEWHEDGEKDE